MFVACASKTMQGAARIAAQRGGAFPADNGISIERRYLAPAPEARRVLKERAKPEPRQFFPAHVVPLKTPFADTKRIIDLVGRMHGATVAELLSEDRTARVAHARQAAMCAVREVTGKSLPEIGRMFGGRDHTTVLHSLRKRGYCR